MNVPALPLNRRSIGMPFHIGLAVLGLGAASLSLDAVPGLTAAEIERDYYLLR